MRTRTDVVASKRRPSRGVRFLPEKIIVEVVVKLDHLEKLSFPPGFLTQRSLSGLAARVNEVLSRAGVDSEKEEKLSYWQLVFSQSKVNGCSYRGEALPHAKWQWPRDTWFQEQLEHHLKGLKGLEPAGHRARKPRAVTIRKRVINIA